MKITLVHNKFNDTASLKDVTFTGYDYDLNYQNIVSVLGFDKSNVLLRELMTTISRFYAIINHFSLQLKHLAL